MNLFVSLMQANKDECESQEKAERERLLDQRREERERLAIEEEARRSVVLTEWERTCLPPQSEEVCLIRPFFFALDFIV